MGILIVLAVVWLGVRVATIVRLMTEVQDPEPEQSGPQDAPGPGSLTAWVVPQDVRTDLQDAPPTDRAEPRPGASVPAPSDPSWLVVTTLWRELTDVLGEIAERRQVLAEAIREDVEPEPARDPRAEWVAALHATITETVPRPAAGPAYLGGREDDAYLHGWDDAVDWISHGHDARAPTWGGVAYLTGWHDGVRAVGRARRGAAAWPTPASGSSAA